MLSESYITLTSLGLWNICKKVGSELNLTASRIGQRMGYQWEHKGNIFKIRMYPLAGLDALSYTDGKIDISIYPVSFYNNLSYRIKEKHLGEYRPTLERHLVGKDILKRLYKEKQERKNLNYTRGICNAIALEARINCWFGDWVYDLIMEHIFDKGV